MFKRRWPWILLAILAAISGVAYWWFSDALAVPMEPEQLTLYSIDGGSCKPGEEPKTEEKFHGFPVLGKLEVTDAEQRREIMSALRRGIAFQEPGGMGKCFFPRHAIHVTANGRVIEYVVCFECKQLTVTRGGSTETVGTSRSPQPIFDEQLRAAGIPLAPSPFQEK